MKHQDKPKHSGNIKKLTLSGILAAVGVILLTAGSLIEVLDLTTAALAAFVVVIAVIELRGFYPFSIYVCISILSVLLLPNKFPAAVFLCFFGFYPMLKAVLERYHPIVSWTVKLSAFNVFLFLSIIFVNKLLKLPDTGLNLNGIVFLLGNFVFVLYDIALTRMITLYLVKIRKLLRLGDYFEA